QSLLVSGSNDSANTYEIWTVNTNGSNAKRIASVPLVSTENGGYRTVGNVSGDHTQFLVTNWHTDPVEGPQMYIGSVQDGTLTPLQPNVTYLLEVCDIGLQGRQGTILDRADIHL